MKTIKKSNFYISNLNFFNNFLLYKFFCKYIYIKALVAFRINNFFNKLNFIFDDFFNFFNFYFKKKKKNRYKKLNFFKKIKDGAFIKCHFFLYKHPHLVTYRLDTLFFKTYIKKNIYLSLHLLKNNFNVNTLFIYKNIRGGFLCFSNKICGFIPKKYLFFFKNLKYSFIFYKRYFIFYKSNLLFFSIVNYKSFLMHSAGYNRNFNSINPALRKFFFKRFKFIFHIKLYYFNHYVTFFLKLITLARFFKKNIIYMFFFKILFLCSTLK